MLALRATAKKGMVINMGDSIYDFSDEIKPHSALSIDEMKEQLADGCKVLGYNGQSDGIWGHLSARIPGTDTYLMKSHGRGLEECEVENIITVRLDGKVMEGNFRRHSEYPLHSETYRARPEVNAVLHTHPPYSVAFGSIGVPLAPVSQDACLFADGLPVWTGTTTLIRDHETAAKIAECLGDKLACLMRNHGILVVGASIYECVMHALTLEKACQVYMIARAMGGPNFVSSPEEALIKKDQSFGGWGSGKMDYAAGFYVRMVREQEAHMRALKKKD